MRIARLLCKLAVLLSLGLGVSACHLLAVHQPDIEQGNAIDARLVDKLKPGMTAEQVVSVLGNPVLNNAFRPHMLNYVYQLRVQDEPTQTKRLTLEFKHGTLEHYYVADN